MRGNSSRAYVVLAVSLAVLMGGCTSVERDPIPTSASTSTPTPTPTPTPTADPVFVPGGTAGQNRPYFAFLLGTIVSELTPVTTDQLVGRLVDGGFERSLMEATSDRTPAGYVADSILVSVRFDSQCLIAQVRGAEILTELADVLGSGTCLVGRTLSL